jgi:hypothetical protein
LLLFRAPFSFVLRLALAFSYFLSFEYAVVARNYSSGILLCFSALAMDRQRLRLAPLYGLAIGLAANTSVHFVKTEVRCPENTEVGCPLFTEVRAPRFTPPLPPPPLRTRPPVWACARAGRPSSSAHLDLDAGVVRVVNGKGMKDRELPVIPRLEGILRAYLAEVRARVVGQPRGGVYVTRDGRPSGLKYSDSDGVRQYRSLRGLSDDEVAALRATLTPAPPVPPYVFVRADPHRSHGVTHAEQALVSRGVLRIVRDVVGPIVGRKMYTHMLRHSFASRLRENGADLQDIQEALGHSVITTTTMYAHISTRRRREKLAEYLK